MSFYWNPLFKVSLYNYIGTCMKVLPMRVIEEHFNDQQTDDKVPYYLGE